MFNCLNVPLTYNNPMALPVAINYLSGNAQGMGFPFFTGNQPYFSGSMNFFIPQTYTFGQNSNSNVKVDFCMPQMYTFGQKSGQSVPISYSSSSTYNFTGEINSKNKKDISTKSQVKQKSEQVKNTPSQKRNSAVDSKNTSAVAPNYNSSTITASLKPKYDLRKDFIAVALKYKDVKESDGSHKIFCVNSGCNKYNVGEWCTDYVSYVVKEAYKNAGKVVPAGFGTHDVETMKNWAIRNNYFNRTSDKSQKGNYIVQNIKPGDIFILNENGASHTGFVSKVNSDGTFQTIEGNRDDKVSSAIYSPNYSDLSGFIQLT